MNIPHVPYITDISFLVAAYLIFLTSLILSIAHKENLLSHKQSDKQQIKVYLNVEGWKIIQKIILSNFLVVVLNWSYIKRFVWYNLYDSQPVFKFSLRLQIFIVSTSLEFTIIQVVHTEFIKVVHAKVVEYWTFKRSCKMIQEQAAAEVIIALISEKSNLRK